MRRSLFALVAFCISAVPGCTKKEPDPVVEVGSSDVTSDPRLYPDNSDLADDAISDWMIPAAKTFVYLEQNWTASETEEFYSLPHGSQLMPYTWLLALEEQGSSRKFLSDENLFRYRFLPRPVTKDNPGGLPVGMVKDGELDEVGFNCAACHTAQINYKGTGIRVDGAPAHLDMDSFLVDLTSALKATRSDDSKLRRFLGNVMSGGASRDDVLTKFDRLIERRSNYNQRNLTGDGSDPRAPWGYARIDAFGAILNQVTSLALQNRGNASPADAPVSIPFIWDTPQHTKVQWNGAAENSKILGIEFGALGRNAGEVLGVFGRIDVPREVSALPPGYDSSVRFENLQRSEDLVRKLWSPEWPSAELMRPLDNELVEEGRIVYTEKKCINCHAIIDRASPSRDPQEEMVPVRRQDFREDLSIRTPVGTDPTMASNFNTDRDVTWLNNRPFGFFPSAIEGLRAPASSVLEHVVKGAILRGPFDRDDTVPDSGFAQAPTGEPLRYKARPLNGIWATAPYLHNGSVPNIRALVSPFVKRPKKFIVGQREFDPDNIGFVQPLDEEQLQEAVAKGLFLFDVDVDGNANIGHEFGQTEFQWIESEDVVETVLALTSNEVEALLEFLRAGCPPAQ